MKIWKLKSIFKNYDEIKLTNFDTDYSLYIERLCDSTNNVQTKWEKIKIHSLEKNSDYTDNPHFWDGIGLPIFSAKAVECLKDLINNKVEFLSTEHKTNNYFIIHIINVLDALDDEQIKVKEIVEGIPLKFEKYAFIKSKVENQHIFKFYYKGNIRLPEVFVSDTFKSFVEKNNLIGFEFTEVWDSEKE